MPENYIDELFNQVPPTLYGLNYLRFIAVIGLIIIAIFSFILINYVGFVIAILGLYCLIMIIFIKFPSLELYEDHFTITKKSIIAKLTDQKTFNYSELENIEFSKGYTNWIIYILTFLLTAYGSGSRFLRDEQNSKSDTMIITTNHNERIEIKRFGSRKDFISIIEYIKMKISPATNRGQI